MRGEKGHHVECPCDVSQALPEHAFTDDPEPRAGEIVDRVIEETELARLLPPAGDHIVAEGDDVATKSENQRERMFRTVFTA